MPVESVLIGFVLGLALVIAILAVVPAGRRLLATAGDVVDASVAVFAIRRALGRDTTTGRERRIADRRAREQADLLRRIGGTPPPAPPTRLVVSGDVPVSAPPGTVAVADAVPGGRRALVRTTAVAAVGIAIVFATIGTVLDRPTGGVLGTTATPAPTAPPRSDRTVVSPAPAPSTPTAAAPTAVASSVAPPPVVSVDGLKARLARQTTVGRTIAVTLSWDVAEGSAPAAGFQLLTRSVEGASFEPLAQLDGDVRSHEVRLGIGRPTAFRLVPVAADGSTGAARDWAPLTATRLQESSGAATTRGTWRQASGPSLSGGGVIFSGTRGARFTIDVEGTDIGWVGTRTPMSGRAEVRVDGKVVGTRDLASAAVVYRRLVLRQHLADGGPHVLEIRPLGDGRVDIDAIVVLR